MKYIFCHITNEQNAVPVVCLAIISIVLYSMEHFSHCWQTHAVYPDMFLQVTRCSNSFSHFWQVKSSIYCMSGYVYTNYQIQGNMCCINDKNLVSFHCVLSCGSSAYWIYWSSVHIFNNIWSFPHIYHQFPRFNETLITQSVHICGLRSLDSVKILSHYNWTYKASTHCVSKCVPSGNLEKWKHWQNVFKH